MKIRISQLRQIIQEEVKRAVRLNEHKHENTKELTPQQISALEFISPEQRNALDQLMAEKFNEYRDLNGNANVESVANIVTNNYKEVLEIMRAADFTDSFVATAFRYMFPKLERDTWRMAAPVVNRKANITPVRVPSETLFTR